jgi:dynein heavy chain
VIEPLYSESPHAIAETMPVLMNNMKMILTLSRHYGTEIRMTNLFQRITNQLIRACKTHVYGGEAASALWREDPSAVISKMRACIDLYDCYRHYYDNTKQKLAGMQNGKQFNFDEKVIFGKCTRFCQRLEKLIDMFQSVQQFRDLEKKKIDGMEKLLAQFDQLVTDFKMRAHDLLDFHNTVFERDFVEFTMHNSAIETAIQNFMESSLARMTSIEKQLELIKRFQDVMTREALQENIERLYLMIFRQYSDDLHTIQHLYEKHKNDPPIPRNMTRIAGNIHWSRQLLRRITSPMRKFQLNPQVFQSKESKKTVKHYNKLARALIEFETLWFQAWQKSTQAAKRGLRARLIVTHPHTNELRVNFDQGVMELIRESKHLQLMGFKIPNSAKIVLMLEDKLKGYYNQLSHALEVYSRVVRMVSPVVRSLLKPHLQDLMHTLSPALTSMNWTSMNIDSFIDSLHQVLSRFEYLVTQVNDILQNRVTKNLELISGLMLLDLPPNKSFTLKEFETSQRANIEKCTELLLSKNIEIERAVNDLVDAVLLYPLHQSISKTSQLDINLVKLHFSHLMYHSLLTATKMSLNALKLKVRSASRNIFIECPLFEVDLSLHVPNVVLEPSLSAVQSAVNAVARDVLLSTQKLIDWGIDSTARPRSRKPFHEKLAADRNLAIVLLLLTGAVENTKLEATKHLETYKKYEWLWLTDPEQTYAKFVEDNQPILEDFMQELHRFVGVEQEIEALDESVTIGSMNLKTENLKLNLKHEVERWKFQYSEQLHNEAKHDMEHVTDMMMELRSKLERDVTDFASLKFVMDAQAEVRDVQSWIDMRFDSITDRYNALEKYLPFGVMSKDEMDAKSVLRTKWTDILKASTLVMEKVNGLQGGFQDYLTTNVKLFKDSLRNFRSDYEENGPMVPGIDPLEAMTRLNRYKREFETLDRKYELYNGGERLFGLPEQKYPALVKTRKELRLLDSLYTLYQSVISTIDEYKGIPWSEVVANIEQMNETVQSFNQRCQRLPKGLKQWEAYMELSKTVEDFIGVLPLLMELSKKSMRERHWTEISRLTGHEFDITKFNRMKLRQVLDADLLSVREDIEEITDAAEKQLTIERKIKEIQSHWDVAVFAFSPWKERGEVILSGAAISEVVEQLEESQASLIQMLTQRHVTPFRELANGWLQKLSDVNDVLESWIKVQMLWMSLEAVFTGGDIARQMPVDTRVFMKVDKEWTTRMMNKAKDVKNVVDCCQNEYIKTMLPTMFFDLEKCQKALDGYLEAKRNRFPRFYFVSNPALLLILSQGSDREAVQNCFPKVFDAIDRVDFKGNNITNIKTLSAGFDGVMDEEVIPLARTVTAKGNIEDWLNDLLKEMKRTMKNIVRAAGTDFEAMPLNEFIEHYCAQATLLGIQFMWTNDVQDALARVRHEKGAMSSAFKKQCGVLNELTKMTTREIKAKIDRTKIETLVTIQVHQRDVFDHLVQRYKNRELRDTNDFEWQKQMRCYWVQEDDECYVKVADVDIAYCYEYLGCKERLVVTPLTDRCYISLSQAMGMHFGGAPAGPAGTGKTETVKDLGRAYGKYVVVFNCSDQMHTSDTAKIYKGLCQSGSWGCFDEFNRIELEVLSVVAQQIQAIVTALRTRTPTFAFPGDDNPIRLDTRCGIFVTMNPGYAGRQELPENLKALFRGVTMMVPDREIIIKVKLASVGYYDFVTLSKKFRVLYKLCEEQLSKQRHYDFGLRNILSVLRTAGVNLRIDLGKVDGEAGDKLLSECPARSNLEERLLMRTLRDMNLSKLVADDVVLFKSLLKDLFPNQIDPEKRRYDAEEEAMKTVIEQMGLVHHESWVSKAIQLYETSLVRHGLMMVGPAGGGKTTATRVLLEALTIVGVKHSEVRMNPKAIMAEEMFGQNDIISGEWTHGIFSSIWQKYNDVNRATTWIVCDGPVDTIWIENLNTVLDDNKLLTLANGDRIPMTDNVRLLFEVQDLRNASPATVSRAGIIYVSDTDLGPDPIVAAWMLKRRPDEAKLLQELHDKYSVEAGMNDWLPRNTSNCMITTQTHLTVNTLNLLEGLLAESVEKQVVHPIDVLERFFLYSIVWAQGGLLEADDRAKFSAFLATVAGNNFPMAEDAQTLYDFFVDEETFEWDVWEAPEWSYDKETFKFSTCLIPTVDSVRAEYLIEILLARQRKPVLIVGSAGTAKTSIVLQYTSSFNATTMLLKKINFSSATTAGMFQTSIEADIEKRQGKTYAPPGGRRMTLFLDDLSMPELNSWGDQPTLEIVRQLIESGGFYFLEKDKRGFSMAIENVQYVGAMNHPGGGRNDVPPRLKRHFFLFNMTPPSKLSIDNIYGSMLRGRFEEAPELESQVGSITQATIDLWSRLKAKMLPTPSKFHYFFTLRDLSRIFQGVLFAPVSVLPSSQVLLALWKHECTRVFCDKLVSLEDKAWFKKCVISVMQQSFGAEVANTFADDPNEIHFVDFLRDDLIDEDTEEVLEIAPKIYEPVPKMSQLQERVNEFLDAYNQQSSTSSMNLVLFQDALEHMMRIGRILGMPRGNALLVGVGGSGRQSLTRLASYIANHEIFQIKLSAGYKTSDFLDDLRKMFVAVGKDGKHLTWIFTDFEIINEEFLEYVNAILATGEVAGLFAKDERDMMCSELRGPAKKEDPHFEDTPDNLYKFFVDRIRDNLHIVLCFSPANEKFAERARRFPALINCCVIDWFLRWPEEALVAVSRNFLTDDSSFQVEAEAHVEEAVVKHIANVHNLVVEACGEYFQRYRKRVFVTPKSYLSFIQAYKTTYSLKLDGIKKQARNITIGLNKLREAEEDVDKMKGLLEEQHVQLGVAEKAANAMLVKLEVSSKEANIKKETAAGIEAKCVRTANQIDKEKEAANKELEGAMPFVVAAEKAAKSINKKDVGIIQKLGKPPDLIKRIMDCVLILNQRPLMTVSMVQLSGADIGRPVEIKTGKDMYEPFFADSYDQYAKKMMVEPSFIKNLLNFANEEKDNITEETMELLEPYLMCVDFNQERAAKNAEAAAGLCSWVIAMASYHRASLIVAPMLEKLKLKEALFSKATAKLNKAQAQSKAAQDEVSLLEKQFSDTLEEKKRLERTAKETQDKMLAANNLIRSLAGEKQRWNADALVFADQKRRLVGDCALACAFVSYCGPFNYEFRRKLQESYFYRDCVSHEIPVTKGLDVNSFLVDAGTVAEWNSQGLPKDDLSIQNGILVTQASRYPLLVDPQGQALTWLKQREAANFPAWGTTNVASPNLRDQLEFCMENGKPLLIEGVVKDVSPMLDPVLEKNLVKKGHSWFIMIGESSIMQDENFRLFLVTKLSNPLFSPELSAKTTVIDFSVTQRGLEDQLLSRVIQREQVSLEEQRIQLTQEVNMNTIALQNLDKQLLERLSASQGNLLDDVQLIGVLADTKSKAQDVKEKIEASHATEQTINKKREQYRPVATRGSILYFNITSLAQINCMYQTSLAQFLTWFDGALATAEKANQVTKRVDLLREHLTYIVYVNINRGLFEADKMTFQLMVVMKMLQDEEEGLLTSEMVNLLLRGGVNMAVDEVPPNPFPWMQSTSWANAVQLATTLDFFRDLRTTLTQNEDEWREWYEEESPEHFDVPCIEERLRSHPCGHFMRLLLLRCFRDDRTRLASSNFIEAVLGKRYTDPVTTRMEDVWSDASSAVPIILLLTPGADPSASLEELAKKKGVKIFSCSMGEGQEPLAERCVKQAMEEGGWALLQNCHLGLHYMSTLDEKIKEYLNGETDPSENCRIWITCEPHNDFPISLLQMSIKVTSEPPRGMKAGMAQSYSSVVDAGRLERVDSKEWRDLVFTTCFLHSAVQERRKFGPVGWCIPYEFNVGDIEASLTFLEKHFFSQASQPLSWPTIRYMVCEVQYGGRVTDDFDRLLFNTIGNAWLMPGVFNEEFTFASEGFQYQVPACDTIDQYLEYIGTFPSHDSPEIFGLHVNADLTFGTTEAMHMLNTIGETRPASAATSGSGKTKEDIVLEKADELLSMMPDGYVDEQVRQSIRNRSKTEMSHVLGYQPTEKDDGFTIPLNVFLYQEITRLNATIVNVRRTLDDLKAAINGEIIMTPQLQDALNNVFDAKPPRHWYMDTGGNEIAWSLPSLALWFAGLINRDKQLNSWLNNNRPSTYWLTGFFNPQGFLTAMRQEVTRRHNPIPDGAVQSPRSSSENWALDDVVVRTEVTDHMDVRRIKRANEGVYIHGLYLEGCSWDMRAKQLKESSPRELFTALPVLRVTAVTSKMAAEYYKPGHSEGRLRDFYNCPCYTRPKRTDLNYIFNVKLPTDQDHEHWTMRGVALLCSKE